MRCPLGVRYQYSDDKVSKGLESSGCTSFGNFLGPLVIASGPRFSAVVGAAPRACQSVDMQVDSRREVHAACE